MRSLPGPVGGEVVDHNDAAARRQRAAGASDEDQLRAGSLTMSQAMPPPMNVRVMTTIQAGLGIPRHSEACVCMASVRQ